MGATVFNLYRTSNEFEIFLQKVSENAGELTDDLIMELHSIINGGKCKIEDAVLAKRNLELMAEQARSASRVFQKEYESCKATADRYQAISDKLSQAMIPVLELTGSVSTVAGTCFLKRTPTFNFALKAGEMYFNLDASLWRQADPTLNKQALRDLAKVGKVPEQIAVTEGTTVSVCIKRPSVTKSADPIESGEEAA